MNVAQICRQALFESGLVLSSGATSPYVTEDELLRWANEGRDELEKQLRAAEQDYLWVTRNSADSDYDWENETYDPSDFALTGTTTTHTYTLPPDLLILKEIRVTTSGQQEVRFQQKDHASPDFQSLIRSTSPPRDLIYWDLVGERTIYYANPSAVALALQLSYIQRSPKLRYHTTGTITTIQASTLVEAAGTPNWLINDLDNAGTVEIGFGPGTWAAVPEIAGTTGPYVDIEVREWPIASFTDDDTLVLKSKFRDTAISAKYYYIASVPAVPSEHHHMIVTYVKMKIQEKIKSYRGRKETEDALDRKYRKMITDVQERQNVDPEFVEDNDGDWW